MNCRCRRWLNEAQPRAPRPDEDDLATVQRVRWHLPLLRHQIASTAGREMRTARLDRCRLSLAGYIERHGIDPPSESGLRR